MPDVDSFITGLAAALAGDQLSERLLLAPSYRVGRQWLDRAAERLGCLANVRVVTMGRLIRDLAEPVLRRRGLYPPTHEEKTGLLGQILEQLTAEHGSAGYFTSLPPSLGLAEKLLAALEELENALAGEAVDFRAAISPAEKAEELAELARRYRAARFKAGLAGLDDIHLAAEEGLADFTPLRLLVPASMLRDFSAMERHFFSRWPAAARMVLSDAEEGVAAEIRFFAADCPANEAREVFRRIQELAIPLDKVEVICIDPDTYVPALCAAGLETFGGLLEELPVTSNSGLPGRSSRPARLLAAWLGWLEAALPPEGLARILDAGLLGEGWREEAPEVTAAALASRLRALPLNGEVDEYRRLGQREADGGRNDLAKAEAWLARLVTGFLPLDNAGENLSLADARTVLAAAKKLLAMPQDDCGRLDAYVRNALVETVDRWLPHCAWAGFNAMEWLGGLAAGIKAMGLGPLPGRLHMGDLWAGGHSGRGCVFVMGLDDGRFPGTIRQDPVLLDRERSAISVHLQKTGYWRRREEALAGLLARVRGRVFLSYSRRDVASGREQFPASLFTAFAERRKAEKGDGGTVISVSLLPDQPEKCLNRRDDWLSALLARQRNRLSPEDFESWFPWLARGERARTARLGRTFGEYDGRVPEAGVDMLSALRTLSPSELEKLASCPLEYFFNQVLLVRRPDRYEPVPGRWLDHHVRGRLLHNLFERFLSRLMQDGLEVAHDNIEERARLLDLMLDEEISSYRRRFPPRDPLAFQREKRELGEACGIFLDNEARRQAAGRPLYLEMRLGGASGPGAFWESPNPVVLTLDSGKTLPLQGRLDRVDRLNDNGGLAIVDYKTGKSDKYSKDDPIRQGRNLQPFLYTLMLERALADAGRPEPVREFSYFFPMPRDEGRTISYERGELYRDGMTAVAALMELLLAGCFPFTTDAKDVAYSDYLAVYGDVKGLAKAAQIKAENDPALADWVKLRSAE